MIITIVIFVNGNVREERVEERQAADQDVILPAYKQKWKKLNETTIESTNGLKIINRNVQ